MRPQLWPIVVSRLLIVRWSWIGNGDLSRVLSHGCGSFRYRSFRGDWAEDGVTLSSPLGCDRGVVNREAPYSTIHPLHMNEDGLRPLHEVWDEDPLSVASSVGTLEIGCLQHHWLAPSATNSITVECGSKNFLLNYLQFFMATHSIFLSKKSACMRKSGTRKVGIESDPGTIEKVIIVTGGERALWDKIKAACPRALENHPAKLIQFGSVVEGGGGRNIWLDGRTDVTVI